MAYTIERARPTSYALVATMRTRDHNEVRPAEHEGIEVNFDASGVLPMKLGLQEVELLPGQLLAFSSRQEHIEIHKRTTQTHKAVVLHDAYLRDFFGGLPDLDKARTFAQPEVLALARELHRVSQAAYVSPLVFEFLCDELSLHIFSGSHLGYHPALVQRAKRRLFRELENPELNLGQLAAEFGMSKFHFLRSFKNVAGISPMKYLRRLRSEWFGQRWLERQASVTATAFDAGFGSLSSFYDSFAREMKTSPREFLNQVRRNPNRVESITYQYLAMPIS